METRIETVYDHECWIDCDPSMGGHMMYPVTEITWTRNQYGPHTMTRREWREYSGGLESRNVRRWNRERQLRLQNEIEEYGWLADSDITALLTGNPWDRS